MTAPEYTKGYRAGIAYEQERIIKLLEELIKSRSENWEITARGYSFEHLIGLIKGENK